MPKRNDDFFKEKKIWSEVKDELLGCYLVPYFNKIFYTRKPILYVDGFAGKGKFDDGKHGSPLAALECLDKSISLYQGAHPLPAASMKFIELNHASDLNSNLPPDPNQRCEIISGNFEEQIIPILENAAKENKRQNVFLYIDPYGVKALDANLFDALPGIFNTAELLINLNSWGFLRMAFALKNTEFRESTDEILKDLEEYDPSTANTVDEINVIAGGDYWQSIVERYKKNQIDGYQAEKEFSYQYKLRLRQKYDYVLDMPIKLKSGHHPKYRMVYATNHPDGCIIMAENIVARTDRLVTDIQNQGQTTLFTETAENEVVSQGILTNKAKKLLAKYNEHTRLKCFLADFYNEYGAICSPSNLIGRNAILPILESSGLVDVKRTPAVTDKGRATSFWDWREKDKKIVEIKGA